MAKRGDIFGSIPVGRIGRTNFNLSHQVTGNFKEGLCYPVFCEDALPGDRWNIKTFNISKLETLISPAMQRTDANLLWFKIPKRLLMRSFKKWYTGGVDGMANVEKPYIVMSSILEFFKGYFTESNGVIKAATELFFGPGSLWQMLGLPIPYDYSQTTPTLIPPIYLDDQEEVIDNWDGDILNQKIDLLPFIAYASIYDEYFRDQTLSEPIFQDDISEFPALNPDRDYVLTVGGHSVTIMPDAVNVFDGGEFSFGEVCSLFLLFRRAWQKDYFTSALPTPQRGPEVKLDVFSDDTVPVTIDQDQRVSLTGTGINTGLLTRFGGTASLDYENLSVESSSSNISEISEDGNQRVINGFDGYLNKTVDAGFTPSQTGLSGTADLTGLSPILITAFRNLFKLQAFLEKNNIAGGRFIEFILAHWAERVPDFTVQRPQFVRATKLPITVTEVTSTAATGSGDMNDLLGDQAGRAKGQGNLGSMHLYCQEPSIILGIYCVTIPPAYIMQGIPKKFQRFTRWDEPYAEFQHIGEQAVLNKELYVGWVNDDQQEKEFGYQQRYSEYKYLPDRVVGDFATSLAYWNQARVFKEAPALNQQFIEQDPSERIFAVEGQKPVIADFWFQIKCKRKLSKFSTPKLN